MRVLFFCRSNLTKLYAEIGPLLSAKGWDVEYLAFEFSDKIHLEKRISHSAKIYEFDNLFSEFKSTYTPYDVENIVLQVTDGKFNLQSAIRADRCLDKVGGDKAIRLVTELFNIWSSFFLKKRYNYVFHEPCTLSINFSAACILSFEHSVPIVSCIQSPIFSDKRFLIVNALTGRLINYKIQESFISKEDIIAKINNDSLSQKRKTQKTFTGKVIGLLKETIGPFLHARRKSNIEVKTLLYTYIDNEQKGILKFLNRVYSLFILNKFSDSLNLRKLRYYYFPLHIEPEATILYWAGPDFSNQLRIIEMISRALPLDHYVVVKDHPDILGYRDYRDYLKIKSYSNVKLVSTETNSKNLISNSIGVVTINGSVGLESLLLGKRVAYFGDIYYELWPGSSRVQSIKDLRMFFSRNSKDTDDAISSFYASNTYTNHALPGFTNFYFGYQRRSELDVALNAQIVADSIYFSLDDVARRN